MEGCLVLNLGVRPLTIKSKTIKEVWIPIIRIKPLESSVPNVLKYMEVCDTIVFTSPRGPKILYDELRKFKLLSKFLKITKSKRFLAIGPSTKESIKNTFNINKVLIPSKFVSEGLALLILNLSPTPSCILILRSLKGSRKLSEVLNNASINYKEVFIYDEVIDHKNLALLNSFMKRGRGKIIITLTSSLIAKAFCLNAKELINRNYVIVCIGPHTLRTAREACKDRGATFLMPRSFTYKSLKELIKETCSSL